MKTNFIKICNTLLTDINNSLTSEELYIYSILLYEKHMKNNLFTSIDLITSLISYYVDDINPKKIKTSIKKTMRKLDENKVIKITSPDYEPLAEMKNNDLILINFYNHHEAKDNFTQIYKDEFSRLSSIQDFHIYTLTKMWSNNSSFKCSYGRWSKLLKISRRNAVEKINDAVERQLIYKSIGEYQIEDGERLNTQDVNRYSIHSFEENDKTGLDRYVEFVDENKKFHEVNSYSGNDVLDIIIAKNNFSTEKINGIDIYPNEDDYAFYFYIKNKMSMSHISRTKLSKEEKRFMEIAERRIKRLKTGNNERFEQVYKSGFELYKNSDKYDNSFQKAMSDYF